MRYSSIRSLRLLLGMIFVLASELVIAQDITGKVIKIQDGDSFLLETTDSTYKVRLNGIDCPEINQPFGEDARDFVNKFLLDSVTIIPLTVDKYGRTIADAFYNDTLINFLLIKNGYAWHYKKYSSDIVLSEAEEEAKVERKGLWSDPDVVAPWDWRSGNYDYSKFIEGDEAKVFICIGSENSYFHNSSHCQDLQNCSSTITLLYPSEAQEVYRKSQCSFCFKLK